VDEPLDVFVRAGEGVMHDGGFQMLRVRAEEKHDELRQKEWRERA